ncbi:GNAT family protein [Streptosporangium longisporum]|uniref:N-acetyltransferase domain-containing protein n=1 Tax=Streptosporangium longisporum TaxID=46187 RepID=A0ABP6KD53_9ACTN
MTSPTSVRLIDVADAPVITRHLVSDLDANVRWLPVRPDGFYTEDGQARWIEHLLDTHAKGGGWPGVIVADGTVVGQIAVSTILRGSFQKGFLGYWVASAFQGRGHASRAVEQVVRISAEELGLHRLEAHTQLENLASHRVLTRNGFRSWGIAHEHFYSDGAWHDEVFWERMLVPGERAR